MENQEFYINDDGIKLHAKLDFPAEEKEKYPLVIVIHGFTGNMEEKHLVEVVKTMNETGFATLRVDMYGHGKSDGEFREHTLYKWVNNALAVVDYAKSLDYVSDLYLCGHSQGGMLTILVGAMEQDLFKAIIPLSPAILIPEYARRGELMGKTFDPENIPDEIDMGEGRTLSGNYFRVAQTIDVWKAVSQYKGHVLLIHGDADESVPVGYSWEAAQRYHDVKLVVIPGDTHCFEKHLDMVTAAVKEFMESMAE